FDSTMSLTVFHFRESGCWHLASKDGGTLILIVSGVTIVVLALVAIHPADSRRNGNSKKIPNDLIILLQLGKFRIFLSQSVNQLSVLFRKISRKLAIDFRLPL